MRSRATWRALATALADRFASAAASRGGARTAARGQCGSGRARELADRAHATHTPHSPAQPPAKIRVGYGGAEQQVNEAEAGVDAALESFALLGYNHT